MKKRKPIKIKKGNIKVLERFHPVHAIEIHQNGQIWFGSTNPETLLELTKAISEFFQKMSKEVDTEKKAIKEVVKTAETLNSKKK